MKTQEVLPVLISIVIIIIIAIAQRQSRLVAAITATMPLNVALGLWIVSASSPDDPEALPRFSQGLLIGILPTLVFLVVVWFGARVGWKLAALLISGYTAWAISLTLLTLLRRLVS
jgi:hypothetical protein